MTHREAWEDVQRAVVEGDVEETIQAIAEWMEVERKANEADALVASCLESARDELRQAAMSFYVSTK